MTTVTKVGGYTRKELIETPVIAGFQLIRRTKEGCEIVDRRSLRDQIMNRVKSRGVRKTFGATHFIVTEKYYQKLISE